MGIVRPKSIFSNRDPYFLSQIYIQDTFLHPTNIYIYIYKIDYCLIYFNLILLSNFSPHCRFWAVQDHPVEHGKPRIERF